MTKKHFEAFAKEIRSYWSPQHPKDTNATKDAMARMVIKISAIDNPRFGVNKFRKACGLES